MHELVTAYSSALEEIPALDEKSFVATLAQVRAGDREARIRLLGSCLRFAYQIAQDMWQREEGEEYIRFVERATVALQKALRTFSGTDQTEFENHATPIIKSYLKSTLEGQHQHA